MLTVSKQSPAPMTPERLEWFKRKWGLQYPIMKGPKK